MKQGWRQTQNTAWKLQTRFIEELHYLLNATKLQQISYLLSAKFQHQRRNSFTPSPTPVHVKKIC
jgi:hypothetical protein